MKRMTACLAALLLFCGAAVADVDPTMLNALPDCAVYLEDNGVDTVARPLSQPYAVEAADEAAAELNTFLDYVVMPNEDRVFLRLTLSLIVPDGLSAREVTITAAGQDWCFEVTPKISEYDGVYYEDYALCMTDESLPMVKAIARGHADEFPVVFTGESSLEAVMPLPAEAAAAIYDAYVSMGGTAQDLEDCRGLWPVTIH